MADIKVKKKRKKKKSQAELLAELKIAYKEGRYATISRNVKSLHNAPKYLQEASKQYRREQRGAHRKRTGAVKESKYTETISPKVTKPKTPKTPTPKTPKPTQPKTPQTPKTPKPTPTKPGGVYKETTPTPKAPETGLGLFSSFDDLLKDVENIKAQTPNAPTKPGGVYKEPTPQTPTPPNTDFNWFSSLDDLVKDIENIKAGPSNNSLQTIVKSPGEIVEELTKKFKKHNEDLTEQFLILKEIAEYKGIDFNPVPLNTAKGLADGIRDILEEQLRIRYDKGWTEWKHNWYNSGKKFTLENGVNYLEGFYKETQSQEMKDVVMSLLYNILNTLMLSAGLERLVNSDNLFSIADTVEAYSINETTTLDDLKNTTTDMETYAEEDFSYASLASIYYI